MSVEESDAGPAVVPVEDAAGVGRGVEIFVRRCGAPDDVPQPLIVDPRIHRVLPAGVDVQKAARRVADLRELVGGGIFGIAVVVVTDSGVVHAVGPQQVVERSGQTGAHSHLTRRVVGGVKIGSLCMNTEKFIELGVFVPLNGIIPTHQRHRVVLVAVRVEDLRLNQ